MERHVDGETCRWRDGYTEMCIDGERERRRDGYTDRRTDGETGRERKKMFSDHLTKMRTFAVKI